MSRAPTGKTAGSSGTAGPKKLKEFDVKKLEPLKMAKSGQGNEKLRFANGDEFDGPTQYVDTLFQPEGNGKYRIAASGAIYSGKFINGRLEGAGTVNMPNGDAVSGTWDSEGNCIGTMTYKNGDTYTGAIVRGARFGHGATTYHNGAVFEGEWVQDTQHGKGKLAFPNGDVIEGMWQHGSCASGVGRRTAADGAVYTGQLSAMSRHKKEESKVGKHSGLLEIDFDYVFFGKGECDYADKSRYEGEWKDSQPNGEGALLQSDANFFQGTWSRGKPQQGKGSIHSDKGWLFEGCILRSMRHGEGVCVWTSLGLRYEGEWKNDRRHGKGKSVVEERGQYAVYEGDWQEDRKHGKGEGFWPCGSSYVGEWHKDHPHGRGKAVFADEGTFEGTFDPTPPNNRGPNALQRRNSFIGVKDPQGGGAEGFAGVPGGVPSGNGRLEFPWGDVYTGEVLQGRPEGMGKLTTPTGDYVEGTFVDGCPAGHCTGERALGEGAVYTGDLHGWMPHGLGKLTFGDGCIYSGSFVDGAPHGKGKYVRVKRNEKGEEEETVVYAGNFKGGQLLNPSHSAAAAWRFPPAAS